MECRICLGGERTETMLVPCKCRGTAAYVHDTCLRTYFSYYPDRLCRVCHEHMQHPWMDTERNFLCATVILVWAAILLTLSHVPFVVKLISFIGIAVLLVVHVRRRQLTYTATGLLVAVSFLLVTTEAEHLLATVFLAMGLLALATLCLFMPIETLFLVMVVALALSYSVFLLCMVAMRTDPAFTSLLLLVIAAFWLVFLRPAPAVA